MPPLEVAPDGGGNVDDNVGHGRQLSTEGWTSPPISGTLPRVSIYPEVEVEQSYTQVKHALGWGSYQARSDTAIRRHWRLVCCAFSFCWWAYGRLPASLEEPPQPENEAVPVEPAGRGKNEGTEILAGSLEGSKGVAGAVGDAVALLEGILRSAPAGGTKSAA